ncbi:hypothetical protein MMC17_010182, partial [Xylographa soralifera]|nr:hypothetical protein [Xylographa soralifera]
AKAAGAARVNELAVGRGYVAGKGGEVGAKQEGGRDEQKAEGVEEAPGERDGEAPIPGAKIIG